MFYDWDDNNMKMIKPIVNILKIIDNYEDFIVGFAGVISDGISVKSEAVTALVNLKKSGKHIVLLSNSPKRVAAIAKILHENKVPLSLFDSIITAGEILHYFLKSKSGMYGALGSSYYQLGNQEDDGVFFDLGFEKVNDISKADFLYMSSVATLEDTIDTYRSLLEHAASLGIPFVCAGNDTSTYKDGKVCLAPGAIAEQYAVLGGKIITVGKPNAKIMEYAMEDFANMDKSKILMIGDNMATDIKGANLTGIHSALVSKGIHVNFLGEGYIPDVAKTRELSNSFDASPDYVISNLRW